jgi:hypothetical protein
MGTIVAVKVTLLPTLCGFALEVRVVVVKGTVTRYG